MDPARIFRDASPALLRFVSELHQQSNLLPVDFLTVQDLVELAEYPREEPLQAFLLLLFQSLEEGSLCLRLDRESLRRRCADLVSAEDASQWADLILGNLDRYPRLIGSTADETLPVLLFDGADGRFGYFQKFFRHEKKFAGLWSEKLREAVVLKKDLAAVLRDVLETFPLQTRGGPLKLDGDQQAALRLALARPATVISGGPGTGKTSLVLNLLRCLVRAGIAPDRIALAAPTGRAAQRLTESLHSGLALLTCEADVPLRDIQAGTLHKLLEYRPHTGTFARHAENHIPADVVLVDEVSMVGLVMMSQLLQSLAPATRLILLGDKDQLPSVEAGAVLSHLASEGDNRAGSVSDSVNSSVASASGSERPTTYFAWLKTNHRSQPAIRETAAAINRQDIECLDRWPRLTSLDAEPPPGAWWCETGPEPRALGQLLNAWADRFYSEEMVRRLQESEPEIDAMFRWMESHRILTILREGTWGSVEINRALDRRLRPRCDAHRQGPLFAGAPVLIARNDEARGLFNGDVGLVVRGTSGLRVAFRQAGKFVTFPAELLPAHELGFAMTAHKSQGSEYDKVLLVLPPTGGRRLLTKEILYTAVTRAKEWVVVSSTREALAAALERRIVRESGMLAGAGAIHSLAATR